MTAESSPVSQTVSSQLQRGLSGSCLGLMAEKRKKNQLKLGGAIRNVTHLFEQMSSGKANGKNVRDQDTSDEEVKIKIEW